MKWLLMSRRVDWQRTTRTGRLNGWGVLTVQAFIVYNAFMRRSQKGKQYTIRDVPSRVDGVLRRKARREGKSLNQVAVEALTLAAGLAEERPTYHDLDHLAGTWVADPEFDAAVQAQDEVDTELWR